MVRLPRGRFRACEDFWTSDCPEQIIEITLPASPPTQTFVKEHGLPPTLRLRLIRVILSSGETEVLLTTLLDTQAYPAAEFKEVYGWRWHEETFFNRFKNIFEVERFSGKSVTAIEQDVRGVLFLAKLESVLRQPDEAVLPTAAVARTNKTMPQSIAP